MPSLLDVAPPENTSKEVDAHGHAISIRGVIAKEWLELYRRFPELRQLVEGREDIKISSLRMIQAQCALIAAGTGHIGKPEYERAAMSNLTSDEQSMLVQEIIGISYPGQVFGPLLDAEEGSQSAPASAKRVTK